MPGKRNKIFIDADAFVAIINPRDSNHQKAVRLSRYVKARNIQTLTSNFAIGEAITVISQRTGREKAVDFGRKVYQGEVSIIDVERTQQTEALERFASQKSKNARFTDFVNMVLMNELGIKTIFSFDKHYLKAGYKLL